MQKSLWLIPAVLVAAPLMAADSSVGYLSKAGAGDLYEQTSSKLVLQSTTDAKVKRFATMMIEDHGKSTAMLKSAASASGVKAPPPKLTPDQQGQISALTKATGSARDALYWEQQKAAHSQALQLHQNYAARGSNKALKAAATKIVPVVKHHIAMLQEKK